MIGRSWRRRRREKKKKEQAENSVVALEWESVASGAPIMAESYLRDQTEPSYPPDAAADWRAAV